MVTSAAGLVAIVLAAFFGSRFTDNLADGYSLGLALVTAASRAIEPKSRRCWPTSPRGPVRAGTATSLIDLAVLALRIHNRQIGS
jgi:hypothetical protein